MAALFFDFNAGWLESISFRCIGFIGTRRINTFFEQVFPSIFLDSPLHSRLLLNKSYNSSYAVLYIRPILARRFGSSRFQALNLCRNFIFRLAVTF